MNLPPLFITLIKKVIGKRPPVDMKTFFNSFKLVLETNNRALEIITDMGEKLSGEYIFDINYVKKAYAGLHADISSSIKAFTSLTRGKYAAAGAFERVDSAIRRAIYAEIPFHAGRVVFYEDITWEMAREVGGKNYHLSEIKKIPGLNVPDGFAITALACDEFMKYNGIDKKKEELGAGEYGDNELLLLREAIEGGRFPDPLGTELEKAAEKLKSRNPRSGFLAVRSSAEEEDGDYSFAGQFETVLNVPFPELKTAYKKVVSSLFAPSAVAYQKRLGYSPGGMRMPAGCVLMVDSKASGVMYTADPSGDKNRLSISASWGLGSPVVEGKVDADSYVLEKEPALKILLKKVGRKEIMAVRNPSGGIEWKETPADAAACLDDEKIIELAGLAIRIEKNFKRPQDIEWALDGSGLLYILQSRPLRVAEEAGAVKDFRELSGKYPALILNKGAVVQRGAASGRVFVLKNANEIESIPKGAVLVARNDSPQFVRVMPYISAIITDTGAPASHMASICREFRIPAAVNTREATRLLKHGQEITFYADPEGNFAVFDGRVEEVLSLQQQAHERVEELYEFRRQKYIMRYISPLNLVNPLTDEFTPDKCRTMHDLLRFMHEKSVQELIETSMGVSGKGGLKALDLPIPAGIFVIDIGGGLALPGNKKIDDERVGLEQVRSEPLRAVLEGMLHPGVWQTEHVALHARDLLASMMRMGDISSGEYAGRNVAVISEGYLNLTLRLGYHFNLLDCYLSEKAAYNHIYFRFVGGATDISKRSRRIRLIAEILQEYGFISSTKGDLIIARLSHIEKEEGLKILEMAGKLIGFSRQLDVVLSSDSDIERYRKNFLEENFKIL